MTSGMASFQALGVSTRGNTWLFLSSSRSSLLNSSSHDVFSVSRRIKRLVSLHSSRRLPGTRYFVYNSGIQVRVAFLLRSSSLTRFSKSSSLLSTANRFIIVLTEDFIVSD